MAIIQKQGHIRGRTLLFRNADIEDASFILALRTDGEKGKHLSVTSHNLSDQEEWLNNYAHDATQAYFIICQNRTRIGTVRLYDAQGEGFSWGSWIMSDEASPSAAIESALMVYTYALDYLGFASSHFDVRRSNESVWRFHERFGATRVQETKLDFIYQINNAAIRASMKRYQKFLPTGITFEK